MPPSVAQSHNRRPVAQQTRTARPAPQTAPIAGDVLEADLSMVPLKGGIAEAMERGAVDVQIATAKRFPRDVTTFQRTLESYATLNADVAASCAYCLKRKDRNEPGGIKLIRGPSIRFAELATAAWGHMRVAGITVDEDARFVTLRGMAWDLQANVAWSNDVKRRITTTEGRTYSDDMIGVTSNAGNSVATRNAVLHVIPRALWWEIYEKTLVVARGDAKTLKDRWARVLEFFAQEYKKKPADIYAYLNIRGEADVTLDHLEEMQGLKTALKDGETTIDEAFSGTKPGAALSPEAVIASELGCSEAVAAAVHAGYEWLKTPPAQRTVQLKKYAGKAEELLQILRDTSGQPLPVEVSESPSPGADAEADQGRVAMSTTTGQTNQQPLPEQASGSAPAATVSPSAQTEQQPSTPRPAGRYRI